MAVGGGGARMSEADGIFEAPCSGQLVFRFDNTFSKLRSKTLLVQVGTSEALPRPESELQ